MLRLLGLKQPTLLSQLTKNAVMRRNVSRIVDQSNKSLNELSEMSFFDEKAKQSPMLLNTLAANNWNTHFEKQNYIICATDLIKKLSIDETEVTNLITTNSITPQTYSVLINKVLSDDKVMTLLEEMLKKTQREIVDDLFRIYQKLVNMHGGKLGVVEIYDLNFVATKYRHLDQLSKAQKVLDYILTEQGGISNVQDVDTIVNYLHLRCGASIKYLLFRNQNELKFKNSRFIDLDSNPLTTSFKYRILDKKFAYNFLNVLLTDKKWSKMHTPSLDSSLIYSMCSQGKYVTIQLYAEKVWGINLSENTNQVSIPPDNEVITYKPEPEVLVALMSSFILRDRNMGVAMKVLDAFMKKYPDLNLNYFFWRRLFQWSNRIWTPKLEKKGFLGISCYEAMKNWHENIGKMIPFDKGLWNEVFYVVHQTGNEKLAMEVLQYLFSVHQMKTSSGSTSGNLKDIDTLIIKYQKVVIFKLVKKAKLQKCQSLIEKWSLDDIKKLRLTNYYNKCHEKLLKRQLKTKQNNFMKRMHEEDDDDDMIIGKLW